MGGQAAYFGKIGEKDSNLVRTYFEQNGAPPCPPSANVAEYILELTAGDRSGKINWGDRWTSSPLAARVRQQIDDLVVERAKRPENRDPRAEREFSAPLFTQIVLTTRRLFIDMYRDAAYPYGVLFSNIMVGLVLGLAFQRKCFVTHFLSLSDRLTSFRLADLGYGVADFQNRVFTAFIAMLNCT